MTLLRWGQSAYETQEALTLEQRLLTELGVASSRYQGPRPPMAGIAILAVTSKVRVDAALLARSTALKLVVTTTSGHDHIDTQACADAGVLVARSPMARRDAVVDTALGMGISLLRDLGGLHQRAEQGVWARSELPRRQMGLVRGLRVGVVGQGVIGTQAAKTWRALGAHVLVSDCAVSGTLGIDALVDHAQLITLHCSLTASSAGLFDARRLSALRPGTILLNTARGACVDAAALLEMPHILAGLDVFAREPWPQLQALAQRPGTLILPHAAGYHDGLGVAVAQELVAAVRALLQGQPLPHPVNPKPAGTKPQAPKPPSPQAH